MKHQSVFGIAISSLLFAGCGGQADSPQNRPTLAQAAQSSQGARIELGPAVTNEAAERFARENADSASQHKRSAQEVGAALAIDTSDREAVRLFYNKFYTQPEVPMDWTGNYDSGNAGTVSVAYQNAEIKRINWYRAMAGLPAATTLSAATSAGAQLAALMMSANNQLSHFPPADWKYYTAAGAKSAGLSNLFLGVYGAAAVDGYIQDFGSNNGPVGHRRWLLHPQSRTFGTGDVPRGSMGGALLAGANAITVTDVDTAALRKARDDFVAWPPRGYVPYQVVYPRWSFSHTTADFSQAKVAVTQNSVPLEVTVEPVVNGYGENTIVWQLPGMPLTAGRHTVPGADLTYHVTVSNVTVGGKARTFDYDVTVIDPTVQAAGVPQPQLSAPTLVLQGSAYTAQIGAMANATGYGLLVYQIKPLGQLASSQYTAMDWAVGAKTNGDALGSGSLLLYHNGSNYTNFQTLTLNKRLAVGNGGGLSFTRSIGYAMAAQTFKVQVSVDDGFTWTDVYSETGRGLERVPASRISVSLCRFAGRAVRLRLAEEAPTSAYVGAGTGWTVSQVGFENVGDMVDEQDLRSADGKFTLKTTQPGSFMLFPRVQYQHDYFSDVGPGAVLTVDGAMLHGSRSSYTVAWNSGALVITDNTGQDGVQTVRQPFRLDFTDLTLAFDTNGNAGKGYRLYRAAFDRKPDNEGLGFWISALDGGLSMEGMADGFVKSDEFAKLYGVKPSNEQIITAMYRNVLHRVPDPEGETYWLNALANGVPVQRLLIDFSESNENKQQVAPEIQLGIAFKRW